MWCLSLIPVLPLSGLVATMLRLLAASCLAKSPMKAKRSLSEPEPNPEASWRSPRSPSPSMFPGR